MFPRDRINLLIWSEDECATLDSIGAERSRKRGGKVRRRSRALCLSVLCGSSCLAMAVRAAEAQLKRARVYWAL